MHTESPRYWCHVCQSLFDSREVLLNHLYVIHHIEPSQTTEHAPMRGSGHLFPVWKDRRKPSAPEEKMP